VEETVESCRTNSKCKIHFYIVDAGQTVYNNTECNRILLLPITQINQKTDVEGMVVGYVD
jgi:hypothetical protein